MPTPHRLLVGGYDGHILTVEFTPDGEQSTLEVTSKTACGAAPTWLTLSQDRKTVYSLDEWGEPAGEVTALSCDGLGQLTKLSSVTTGGLWPCHASLLSKSSPPRLVATNYKGASVALIPLHESGDVDLTSSSFERVELLGTGTPGPHRERQRQDHPHGAHVDPRETVVVVPDLGTDDLRVFGIRHAPSGPEGTLEELESIKLQPGSGPRHVLFSQHDGGEKLYVMNELDNSITVFAVEYPSSSALAKALSPSTSSSSRRDDAYPKFTLLQSNVSLLPSQPFPHQTSFESWHAAELVLSPSGETLYASNRAEGHNPLHPPHSTCSDLVAVFPIDSDGRLIEDERELVEIGARCPRHFSLSERDDARWVAVSCHDSDELVMFERRGTDGREWREVARLEGCGKPAVALWL